MEKPIEKNDSGRKRPNLGGYRPGSGWKPDLEAARKAGIAEGYRIAKTEFWLELAESKAVIRLQEILGSDLGTVGGKVLLGAIKETLDRALGRPKETHEHTGKDGGPIEVTEDDSRVQALCLEYEKKLRDTLSS